MCVMDHIKELYCHFSLNFIESYKLPFIAVFCLYTQYFCAGNWLEFSNFAYEVFLKL